MSEGQAAPDRGNRFKGANVTKKIKLCGQDTEIRKLSVSQVTIMQERGKALRADPENESLNYDMLFAACRFGCADLADFTDEEMKELPLDELAALSNEILKYSGLGNPTAAGQ